MKFREIVIVTAVAISVAVGSGRNTAYGEGAAAAPGAAAAAPAAVMAVPGAAVPAAATPPAIMTMPGATAPAAPAGTLPGAAAAAAPGTPVAATPPAPSTAPATAVEAHAEPSAIEAGMADAGAAEASRPQPLRMKPLTQFGYGFFRSDTAFAPVLDVPVGPDYILGPGDTIVLSVWGSVDGAWPLEVSRSGEVTIPHVGAVRVWGTPFGKLHDLLRGELSKVYRNVQLNVTMGKLRLIKVYLVGQVTKPGDYDVSSLSTVINALGAAGGPTKNGSLRNIQVKRDGKVVETIDLYDFFLKGDKSRDIRLQSGDTIFVPVIGPVAGIGGNVRRPAIYELKDEKTLKDLLALADGINPMGYLNRVQITRIEAHDRKVVSDFNLAPVTSGKSLDLLTADIPVRDLDVVNIFPIDATLRNQVMLTGYVLRPGAYALRPGMRISDMVGSDNLLPEYYREVVELTRLFPPDMHPEKIYVNLGKALAHDPAHDLILQEFDALKVFSRFEMEEMPTVRVSGEVLKPGPYRLYSNMRLRDLVLIAGGMKQTAYTPSAELARIKKTPAGSVTSQPIEFNLAAAMAGNPDDNLLLEPFDELTVRKIPQWAEETDRYVTLRGEVRFPGVYPIFKGERLSSVLQRAGGYTDKAYLKGAKFTRRPVAQQQQQRMEEIIARTEQDIAQKQTEMASVASSKEELDATRSALDGLRRSLDKLKTAKAEGRVSIALTPLETFKGSTYDVELMGGDSLEIPQSTNSVLIVGEVYNPTTVMYLNGARISDYLKKAGGPTTNAEQGEMYVIRADGTVESREQSSGFLFYGGFMSLELGSGDTIVVPQKLEKIAWMRDIKDIAIILGNLALAAGVAIAAGL